jgi:hypothetical protein
MDWSDPRPDLAYDSKAWNFLLPMAEATNTTLAYILHGFRCGGLRLHKGGQGYALRPDLDPDTSLWATKNQYIADRDKWLMPYQEDIINLLDWLTKRS